MPQTDSAVQETDPGNGLQLPIKGGSLGACRAQGVEMGAVPGAWEGLEVCTPRNCTFTVLFVPEAAQDSQGLGGSTSRDFAGPSEML